MHTWTQLVKKTFANTGIGLAFWYISYRWQALMTRIRGHQ